MFSTIIIYLIHCITCQRTRAVFKIKSYDRGLEGNKIVGCNGQLSGPANINNFISTLNVQLFQSGIHNILKTKKNYKLLY